MRDWAVAELGLRELEILAHRDNPASQRVAERAGFTATGEERSLPRMPPGKQAGYRVFRWPAVDRRRPGSRCVTLAADMDVAVSYCIVNTEQRELLLRCLDAVARDRAALTVTSEVLVLDNASRDGSAGAARAHPAVDTLIRLEPRDRQGRQRHAAPAARPRPLLPAAQRGRGAAAGRHRRAARGARGAPAARPPPAPS